MYDDVQEYDLDFNQRDQFSSILRDLCQPNFHEDQQIGQKPDVKTQDINSNCQRFNQELFDCWKSSSIAKKQQIKRTQSPGHIEVSLSKLFQIQRSKKGRQNQAKNIYQIFKNETVYYLQMLSKLKILSQQDVNFVQKFKQESPSITSFTQFLKNERIKNNIQKFYCSPQIAKRILQTERLSFFRKIQVIKKFQLLLKILNNSSLQE